MAPRTLQLSCIQYLATEKSVSRDACSPKQLSLRMRTVIPRDICFPEQRSLKILLFYVHMCGTEYNLSVQNVVKVEGVPRTT